MDRSPYARVRLLFAAGVVVVCAAVWFAAYSQRSAVSRTAAAQRANTQMLVAMLDQETGLRGYKLTGLPVFLQPYTRGRVEFERGLAAGRTLTRGNADLRRAIEAQVTVARSWQDRAQAATLSGRGTAVGTALGRKAQMDAFRRANAAAADRLDRCREAQLRRAGLVPVV